MVDGLACLLRLLSLSTELFGAAKKVILRPIEKLLLFQGCGIWRVIL
jgi:hypothetical protein